MDRNEGVLARLDVSVDEGTGGGGGMYRREPVAVEAVLVPVCCGRSTGAGGGGGDFTEVGCAASFLRCGDDFARLIVLVDPDALRDDAIG